MVSYLMLVGTPAMPYAVVVAAVIVLALAAGVIDVLCRDDVGVRVLPRSGWFLVVVLIPLVGSLAWFIFGRPRRRRGRARRSTAHGVRFPEYDRPGRFVAQDPVADAEFLQRCRERAELQRREAEVERRRRQS